MDSEIDKSEINNAELNQILIEQDWRFSRLLIGLSSGILLFSIQIYKDTQNLKCEWILYITWLLFLITFISGLFDLFLKRKVLNKESKIKEAIIKQDVLKISVYKKDIVYFDKFIRVLSYILFISFLIGFISMIAYELLNLK
jgi:hypothetical protein